MLSGFFPYWTPPKLTPLVMHGHEGLSRRQSAPHVNTDRIIQPKIVSEPISFGSVARIAEPENEWVFI